MIVNNKEQIKQKIIKAAQKYDIDPNLLLALAEQESGFSQNAVSKAGAIGVMQLMPATAKELGVDPNNVDQNIDGGARYLAQMIKLNNGNIPLALASYNAGYGSVSKYKGIPPYGETQKYVKNIMANYTNTQTDGGNVKMATNQNAGNFVTRQDLIDAQAALGGSTASAREAAMGGDSRLRLAEQVRNQYLLTDSLSYEDAINSLRALGVPEEQLALIPRKDINANTDALLGKISPYSKEELSQMTAAELDAYNNLVKSQNQGINMYDLLDKKYNDLIASSQAPTGSYNVTPEDIDYARNVNLMDDARAAIFGMPKLRDIDPMEIAKAKYQAEIASRQGMPYEVYEAQRLRDAALREKQIQDALTIYGKQGEIDKANITSLNNIITGQRGTTNELIKARGGAIEKAEEGRGKVQTQAMQNMGDLGTTAMQGAQDVYKANIGFISGIYSQLTDLQKADMAHRLGIDTAELNAAVEQYKADRAYDAQTRGQDVNLTIAREGQPAKDLDAAAKYTTAISPAFGWTNPQQTTDYYNRINLLPESQRDILINSNITPSQVQNTFGTGSNIINTNIPSAGLNFNFGINQPQRGVQPRDVAPNLFGNLY